MKDKKYLDKIIIYCSKILKYLEEVNTFQEFESNEEKLTQYY